MAEPHDTEEKAPRASASASPSAEETACSEHAPDCVRIVDSEGFTHLVRLDPEMPHLPVLLVHGMHARDYSVDSSPLWGRIPERLRQGGSQVFFGCQDAWGDIERNSLQLYHSIHEVLERTGAEKIHMIAHSKGGLDIRHCVHVRDLGDHTASIVTLGTPYHGLRMSNALMYLGPILSKVVAPIIDNNARKMGDDDPDSLGLLHSTTTYAAETLVGENEDLPGIEYRSYAFVPRMTKAQKLNPRSLFIQVFDGDNDGIVPLASTEATNWCVVRGERGVAMNHDDSYDLNEKDIELTMPDGTVYKNSPDLLEAVVQSLDLIAWRRAKLEAARKGA